MKAIFLLGLATLCLYPNLKAQLCVDADPLSCSSFVSGSNATGQFNESEYCGNPFAVGYFSSEKVYIIEPTVTTQYDITMTITAGGDLDIFMLEGDCDNEVCVPDLDQVTPDIHTAVLEAGSTYYLIVDGGVNGAGELIISEFTIEVECTPTDFPCDAMEIECGTTSSGNNSGSSALDSYNCIQSNSVGMTGPEKVFFFEAPRDGDYLFSLTNFNGDLDMFFIGDDCDPEDCFASTDANSSNADDDITLSLQEDDFIYIIIDGDNGTISNFDYTIVCPPACEAAFEWTEECGKAIFENSSTGTALSYTWTIDGVTYTDENPCVEFDATGTYLAILEISNDFGDCTDAIEQTIEVEICLPDVICECCPVGMAQHTFEGLTGNLPPPFALPVGWMTAYGSPVYTPDGCEEESSIELRGPSIIDEGSAARYTLFGSFVPTNVFEAEQTYCIKYCYQTVGVLDSDEAGSIALTATNDPQNLPCTDCKVVDTSPAVSISDGWSTHTFYWTPDRDYQDLIVSAVIPTPFDFGLPVLFDDLCITPIEETCEAGFEFSDDGCGNVEFRNTSCGLGMSVSWIINGSSYTEDTISFAGAGVYDVSITVMSSDGCSDTFSEQVTILETTLVLECPDSFSGEGVLGPDGCTFEYTVPNIESSTSSYVCFYNGQNISAGMVLTLDEGVHNFSCSALDDCGNQANCPWTVTVLCQECCPANIIASDPICNKVFFTGSTCPAALSNEWTITGPGLPAGGIVFNEVSPCFDFPMAGTYTVLYSINCGAIGNISDPLIITIPELTNPELSCPTDTTFIGILDEENCSYEYVMPVISSSSVSDIITCTYNGQLITPTQQLNLAAGTHTFICSAVDECDLLSQCSWNVAVGCNAEPCDTLPLPQIIFPEICVTKEFGRDSMSECSPNENCETLLSGSGSPNGQGDETCLMTCDSTKLTYYAVVNPGSMYRWIVNGGTIIGPDNQDSICVEWSKMLGAYIRLIETDSRGCVDSTETCLEIIDSPTADFSFAPTDACYNAPVQFTNLSMDYDLPYHVWDFGDGQSSIMENPSHAYSGPGIYTVCLTVAKRTITEIQGESCTCEITCSCEDTACKDITIDNLPGPPIYCLGTVCVGDTACYYTDDLCVGAIYNWNVTGGTIVSGGTTADKELCVVWNAGPIGLISLDVPNCSNYCTKPTVEQVSVIDPAGLVINGPIVVCEYSDATYTAPKLPGTSYQWQVSGGTILTALPHSNYINVRWDRALPFPAQVILTATNVRTNCSATDTLDVDIRPDIQLTGNEEVCDNAETLYSAFPNSGNSGFTWTVTGGTILITNTYNITVKWDQGPGNYQVTATAIDPTDFCRDEVILDVQVLPRPAAPTISGPPLVCPGGTYTYTGSATLLEGDLEWIVTNGTVSPATGSTVSVTWDNSGLGYGLGLAQKSASTPYCISDTTDFTPQVFQSLFIQGPTSVCVNRTTIYNANITPAVSLTGQDIKWTLTDPGNPSNPRGSIISGQGTSAITIQWTNDHLGGAIDLELEMCGVSDLLSIAIFPVPTGIISGVDEICIGGSSVLTMSGNFSSYTFGNVVAGAASNPQITVTAPGTYNFSGSTIVGCTVTDSYVVKQHEINTNLTAIGEKICTGGSSNLVITAPSGYSSYVWERSCNNGPFQSVGGNTAVYTETTSNACTYRCIISDGVCTETSGFVTTYISDCSSPGGTGTGPGGTPCTTTVDRTFTISDQCNFTKTFTGVAQSDVGHVWEFGDGNTDAGQIVTHTYSNIGIYDVCQTVIDSVNNNCATRLCQEAVVPMEVDFDWAFDDCNNGTPMSPTFQFTDRTRVLPNYTLTYLWEFFDECSNSTLTSTAQNPLQEICSSCGAASSVKLTVTSSGPTGTCVQDVTKMIVPAGTTAMFTTPPSICAGQPFTMTNSSCGDVSRLWTYGDGNTSTLDTHTKVYQTAGTYTITLETTDRYGCDSAPFTQTITVAPAATVSITSVPSPADVCETDLATLTAAPAGLAIYRWINPSDNTTALGSTNSSVYQPPVTGNYAVETIDVNGCEAVSNEINVIVHEFPFINIEGAKEICEGQDLELNLGRIGNYFIEWTMTGSAFISTQTRYVVSGLAAGTYTVTLKLTDASFPCDKTWTVPITVHPLPARPIITSMPAGPYCAGDNIILTVSNPVSGLVYNWSTGQSGLSISLGPALAGSVSVRVTDPATGCSATSNVFDIHPLPDICPFPTGCWEACDKDTICMPAIYDSYEWLKDGLPIPGATGNCFEITDSGKYQVILKSAAGCVDTTGIAEVTIIDCFCENVSFSYVKDASVEDSCCWLINIDNQFDASYFKGIQIDVASPTTIAHTTAQSGWNLGQFVPNTFVEYFPTSGNSLPLGAQTVARICTDNFSSNPHTITASWLSGTPGNCEKECEQDLELACEDADLPCLEMVEDSINCITKRYCIKVRNNSSPAIVINSVDIINLTQGNLNPNPQAIPPLSSGSTSDWICYDYTNLVAGDQFCYNLTGHFIDPNGNYLSCCFDTTAYCKIVPPCPNLCEDTDIFYSKDNTTADSCCWFIELDNQFDPNVFKGMAIDVTLPTTISYHGAQSNWKLGLNSTFTSVEFYPINNAPIPIGRQAFARICTDNFNTTPHIATVSWLTGTAPNCVKECPEDLTFDCNIIDPPVNKCLEIVADSINCEAERYCIKVKNNSLPPFSINQVKLIDIAPGNLMINPQALTPPLANGATSDWLCYDYTGVTAGDDICYKVTGHFADSNGNYLDCCSDTTEYCKTIPFCDECPACPNGFAGTNLILNGDFETGGFANNFTSDYTNFAALLTAGQADVRRFSSLLNPNWSAFDHTTGLPPGSFLVADGPNPTAAVWRSNVLNVTLGQTYYFCAWVNNLVVPDLVDSNNPIVEVIVNGTDVIVTPITIPQLPDNWVLITGSYTAIAPTAQIEIFNRQTAEFADLAIDDISFTDCGVPLICECDGWDNLSVSGNWGQNSTSCGSSVTLPPCNYDINISGDLLCNDDDCDGSYNWSLEKLGGTCVQPCFGNFATGTNLSLSYDLTPNPLLPDETGPGTYVLRLFGQCGDNATCDECLITIVIPDCPIDDCCQDRDLFDSKIAQGFQLTDLGNCTFQVCANQFDTCHWFGTPGPDWGDGPQQLQVITPADAPNNCWTHTYTQDGTYKIAIHVYEGDPNNNENCWNADLCTVVTADCCEPEEPCLAVTNTEAKDIICEADDCYTNPLCQVWLRQLLDASTNAGCQFVIDYATFYRATWNGQTVFVGIKNGAPDGGSQDIYSCNGTLIQSCTQGVGPPTCMPDAGINIGTDLANYNLFWSCGDVLPALADCGIRTTCQSDAYCNQWIIDYISANNSSCIGLYLETFSTAIWMGQTVYVARSSVVPDASFEIVFDCKGNEIQSCGLTIAGPVCTPDLSTLDIFSGLSGEAVLWTCGDAVPTLSAGCLPDPTVSCTEYCITVENNIDPPRAITQIDLTPQLGTVSISPNPVFFAPLSTGQSTTITFMVCGDLDAGDQVKFDITTPDPVGDDCCLAADPVCLITPPCPPDTMLCCTDFDAFCNLVDLGFQVTIDSCTVTVDAPQFRTCHWFGTSEPDWGDGTPPLQVITPAAGAGPWTHSYASSGTYDICIQVYEGDDIDNFCWDKPLCTQITVDCGCDSTVVGTCCMDYNGVTSTDPFGLISPTVGNGWGEAYADVDNDGDYDYLFWRVGGIFYFENQGTATAPAFNSSTALNLFADEFGVYAYDYNNDGYEDLFTIDENTRDLIYHENLGIAGVSFASQVLGTNFPISTTNPSIAIGDLSNDGIADLLVLNAASGRDLNLVYFEGNCSTISTPCFTLVGNSYASPFVDIAGQLITSFDQVELEDGDCDGDLDVFIADGNAFVPGQGVVYYLENYGNVVPVGSVPDIEKTTITNDPFGLTSWVPAFEEATLRFVDINADGNLEAFISTGFGGVVHYYENCQNTPPMSACCCEDFDAFCALVDQGFQVTTDSCGVTVDAPQFGPCHWFGTAGPDWGDGPSTLPSITPAVGAGPWSHTYNADGSYTICITVFEGEDVDDLCWQKDMCTTIQVNDCPCDTTDLCDKLDMGLDEDPDFPNECCFIGWIENDACDDLFKGIKLTVAAPASIAQVQTFPGWTITQLTPLTAELYPSTSHVPLGDPDVFKICSRNDGSPLNVTMSWLQQDTLTGNCIELCPVDLVETCSDIDYGCVEIVEDSTSCSNKQYCFRALNVTNPNITLKSLEFIWESPAGATLTPDIVSVVPPLMTGDTTDWICVNYNTVGQDSMCFVLVGHEADIPAGEPVTWCCTDTTKYFIVDEDCPCDPDSISCDDLMVTMVPDPATGDTCCFVGTIENNFCADFFKGVKITTTAPATISSVQGLNGWIINAISSTEAEVYPPSPHIPLGQFDIFSGCNDNGSQNPFNVQISWLYADVNGNCTEHCETEFDLSCVVDPPPVSCIAIVEDSLVCDIDRYCFRIQNNTAPYFPIESIDMIGLQPSGTSVVPNPISISPALGSGAISDWICVDYTGAVAGDSLCYFVVGHNKDVNLEFPTWCCATSDPYCVLIEDELCPCKPDSISCDDLMLTMVPDPATGDTCCFIGTIENNFCADFFKGVKITTTAPATISSVQGLNGWIINAISSTEAELYPGSPHIPLGQFDIFSGCNDNGSQNPFNVQISWLYADANGNCTEHCETEFDLSCEVDPPPLSCIAIVEDSLVCDIDRYCFKIQNNTAPYFPIESIDMIGLQPAGTSVVPNPISISPALGSGVTSDWICVDYTGAVSGDSLCYFVVGHKEDVNLDFPTWCCATSDPHCVLLVDEQCPSDCCQDFDAFCDLVDLGFDLSVTDSTLTVMTTQFDSCHWYSMSEPDWGDGTPIDFTPISAADTVSWTHAYDTTGSYEICIEVFEGDSINEVCWAKDICVNVFFICKHTELGFNPCGPSVMNVPTGFSPNGDGFNDVLTITGPSECTPMDLTVFNRWGQVVFEQFDYDNTWDGRSNNNEDLPEGTYYLIIDFHRVENQRLTYQKYAMYLDLRR